MHDQLVTELKLTVDAALEPVHRRIDSIEVLAEKAALDTREHRATPGGALLTKSDTMLRHLEHRGQDVTAARPDEFRLGAVIAAAANPRAARHLSDTESKALASGTGSTGGFLLAPALSAMVIDRARNAMRVQQAGAMVMPMESGQTYIPRLATSVDAAWRAEGSSVTEDTAAWERVTLTARTCAVLTRMSVELADDLNPAALSAIEGDLVQAVALKVDYAALLGTGTSHEPQGIYGQAGVDATDSDAVPTDHDELIDLVAAVKAANHEPNALFMSSGLEARYAKLRTGITNDQTPLPRPAYLSGVPTFVTNQLPSTGYGTSGAASPVITGDFRQLILGFAPQFGIRVMSTPHRYADTLEVAVVAYVRADVALAHPEAFATDAIKEA